MDAHSNGQCSKRTNDGNPVCRICFGEEEPNNDLIAPCKCEDNYKYVHEEWLKSTILLDNTNWDGRRWERCLHRFNMTGLFKNKFKWKLWFCVSMKYMICVPIVMFLLSVCVLYAALQEIIFKEYVFAKNTIVGTIAIMCILSLSAIMCQLWVICDMFYEPSIENWKIFGYEAHTNLSISASDALVSSMVTDNAAPDRSMINMPRQSNDVISQLSRGHVEMIRNQYHRFRENSYSSRSFGSVDLTQSHISGYSGGNAPFQN